MALLSLPIVHYTLGTILAVAFSMTLGIFLTAGKLALEPDATGYEVATNLYRAPIAIALLSIPVLALLASNHRSVQTMSQMELTAKQIELTTGQNLFANYYKHIEEFSKWCEHIKGFGEVKSRRKLHKKLFPNARSGDFAIPGDITFELNEFGSRVIQLLREAQNENSLKPLIKIRQVTFEFARTLWLSVPSFEHGQPYIQDYLGKVFFPEDGPKGYVRGHMDFIKAVDELFSFDPAYHSSPVIAALSNLSVAFVPVDTREGMSIKFIELDDLPI